MNPKMNDNETHKTHEAEDFEETITFESDQFAIVDAEVVKSLKDKVPLADLAVFVPTKQSREMESTFKITAEYTDASLKRLIIEPVSVEDSNDHADQMEEGIQIRGKGGDPVERKLSKNDRIAGGARPKSAHREKRNKRYSKGGDPGKALTKTKPAPEKRVEQAVQIDGARRDNYGQPRHQNKLENECIEFVQRVKEGTISEDYLGSMEHIYEIRTALVDIRDNGRVLGESFDLVYESINILDDYRRDQARGWIEDIVLKGGFNV